jgi:LVIVD repeat
MRILSLLFFVSLLASCWPKKPYPESSQGKVAGWKPVYGADTAYKKLTYHASPVTMTAAGKIYVLGNTIYQNDIGKGIHIINNSNPSAARRVAFIELPGNTEMAIKGTIMYANNYNDLVLIDISNVSSPREVKRLVNMFASYNSQKPYTWQAPPDTGYYECPRFYNDSTVISWRRDSVYQYCYKF